MMLGGYLRHALSRPWKWGEHDCCTFLADWMVEQGRDDPMAFIRRRYESEHGALRRIREGDGLLALVTRGMAEAGIDRVEDPHAGDGGVIEAPTECGIDHACGIFTGERWAVLGVHGLIFAPAVPLGIWRA